MVRKGHHEGCQLRVTVVHGCPITVENARYKLSISRGEPTQKLVPYDGVRRTDTCIGETAEKQRRPY